MFKSLKSFAVLAVVMGAMVGCSSNKPAEDPNANANNGAAVNDAPVAAVDPAAAIADLATVFYFEFDSAELLPAARAALIAHADYARTNSKGIRLEGHADERGTREYNMALGERRANAVRDFLVLQGVSGGSVETVSYGEERAAENGSDETSWSKNRRVELQYQ